MSAHASANMLNIQTHNGKEEVRGRQTTLRLHKVASLQQRQMGMNKTGCTCTHVGSLWVACRLFVKSVLQRVGQHLAGSTN